MFKVKPEITEQESEQLDEIAKDKSLQEESLSKIFGEQPKDESVKPEETTTNELTIPEELAKLKESEGKRTIIDQNIPSELIEQKEQSSTDATAEVKEGSENINLQPAVDSISGGDIKDKLEPLTESKQLKEDFKDTSTDQEISKLKDQLKSEETPSEKLLTLMETKPEERSLKDSATEQPKTGKFT